MNMPLPVIDGHDMLTNSRLACYKRCPREHLYRYELGIRPDNDAQPLRMGQAFHKGLDLRAAGADTDSAIIAACSDYETLPLWANTDEAVADWMTEREIVARLLTGYWWYWEGVEAIPEITVAEVIATEQAFCLPLVNPETGMPSRNFQIAGKIDKIVRLADGRVAVMEHKTTGDSIESDSDYWRRLKIDQQISLYYLAARALGHDVQTVLYDVARKPGIRPRLLTKAECATFGQDYSLKPRETPSQFGDRLSGDIAERPTHYFARREIPRLTADIDEFRHELWQMQQQLRESQKAGRWFRNTSSCMTMGRCAYFGPCSDGHDFTHAPSGMVRVGNLHPELENE